MDNSIHDALRVINESHLSNDEKIKCRHFLKRNANEAPFIIDAKNRSLNDESVLSDFLRQMTIEESVKEIPVLQSNRFGDTNYNNQQQLQQQQQQQQYRADQRPDLRRGGYNESFDQETQLQQRNEVNIYKYDNDSNPLMSFEPGVDWTVVKHNLKLHSGWLKKKGDANNRRVKSPFQGGDYTLVDMIPEFKIIRISYNSVFSFWNSEQKVKLKYGDTQDEVRKRIQHVFKFEKRHFSLYHLREKGSKNKYTNMDFDDLDDSKQYELVIPWLAKFTKHKDEPSSSSSSSTKTNDPKNSTTSADEKNNVNNATTVSNSQTTKGRDINQATSSSSSSPSLLSKSTSTPTTYTGTGVASNQPNDFSSTSYSTSTNNPSFSDQPTYDPSSTITNSSYTQ